MLVVRVSVSMDIRLFPIIVELVFFEKCCCNTELSFLLVKTDFFSCGHSLAAVVGCEVVGGGDWRI